MALTLDTPATTQARGLPIDPTAATRKPPVLQLGDATTVGPAANPTDTAPLGTGPVPPGFGTTPAPQDAPLIPPPATPAPTTAASPAAPTTPAGASAPTAVSASPSAATG